MQNVGHRIFQLRGHIDLCLVNATAIDLITLTFFVVKRYLCVHLVRFRSAGDAISRSCCALFVSLVLPPLTKCDSGW